MYGATQPNHLHFALVTHALKSFVYIGEDELAVARCDHRAASRARRGGCIWRSARLFLSLRYPSIPRAYRGASGVVDWPLVFGPPQGYCLFLGCAVCPSTLEGFKLKAGQ